MKLNHQDVQVLEEWIKINHLIQVLSSEDVFQKEPSNIAFELLYYQIYHFSLISPSNQHVLQGNVLSNKLMPYTYNDNVRHQKKYQLDSGNSKIITGINTTILTCKYSFTFSLNTVFISSSGSQNVFIRSIRFRVTVADFRVSNNRRR